MNAKPTALMAVYHEIDVDGRVQRAAEALAADFAVRVLALASERPFESGAYEVETVALPSKAGRVRRHAAFWMHLCRLARRMRPELVYVHDYYLAFPGWLASRLTGSRLVYDAHELIIPGGVVPMLAQDRAFYLLERFVAPRANVLVAANGERAELMREHYGLGRAPLVIRNIPPQPASLPGGAAQRLPLPPRASGDDRQVRLVYQGDLSFFRGVDRFIQALRLLDSRFHLVLVGKGPHVEAAREMAADPALAGRLHVLGAVSRAELHGILEQCDVGIATYSSRGLNNVYCAPNKVYEYAQAGLPVVTSAQPPLRSVMAEYGIGAVVESEVGDDFLPPAGIAAAVREVAAELEAYRSRLPHFLRDHRWESERERLRSAVAGAL